VRGRVSVRTDARARARDVRPACVDLRCGGDQPLRRPAAGAIIGAARTCGHRTSDGRDDTVVNAERRELLTAGTIDVLASTPATLRALLLSLPNEIVETPGAEGWSPRDVVAHLLARHDDALVGRVRAMLDQDDPVIPDIP